MDCKSCKSWLTRRWLEGPRPESVQAHLADCLECRRICIDLARLNNQIEGMPKTVVGEGFRRRVIAAVVLQPVGTHVPPGFKKNHIRGILAVASCALLLFALMVPYVASDQRTNAPLPHMEIAAQIPVDVPGFELFRWPLLREVVQEEGKKVWEVAYRCVEPAAIVGLRTVSKTLREVPGPFPLVGWY